MSGIGPRRPPAPNVPNEDHATQAWVNTYFQQQGTNNDDTVYVAAPTGNSGHDNGSLTAAIASCPSGGVIQLQRGTYALTGLTINKPLTLRGAGGADLFWANIGTLLTLDSATGVAIKQTSHSVHYENLAIQNIHATAPTAGAGIQTVSGGGDSNHYGPNLSIRGFYNNIDHQAGGAWFMDPSCFLCDWAFAGLKIQNVDNGDFGDMSVSGMFYAGPTNTPSSSGAAILWQSGGGFKGYSIKINNFGSIVQNIGILMYLEDGVGTSDFIFTASSIENSTFGFLCEHAGPLATGVFEKIVIVGNQFAQFNASSVGVALNSTSAGLISAANITGNVFTQEVQAISLTNVDRATIGPNVYQGVTTSFHDGGGNTNLIRVDPASVQLPSTEIGYDQITADVNVTGLASSTANTIIAGSANTFDGAPVTMEFYAPAVTTPGVAAAQVNLGLYEGSTLISLIAALVTPSAANMSVPVLARKRFTPTSGSHTYTVKAWTSSTTGTPHVSAGTGASGGNVPAYLRFTKV